MSLIGIDIGGTKIYAGLVRDDKVIRRRRKSTPADSEEGVELVSTLVDDLRDGEEIYGMGVGMAGFIDIDQGVLISSPNLPGWSNTPLKRLLEEKMGLPVFIDNDVNCATLAEFKLGAGVGRKDICAVFPGTGIGGGIIIDGRLIHGASFCGGEIGHIPIKLNGPRCACGLVGCLETLCSGPAIIKSTNRPLNSVTEISKAAEEGEEWAVSALEQAGGYLTQGIAILVNALNPEIVVLGGGVIEACPRMLEIVREKISFMALPQALKGLTIETARLRSEAGLLGAALIAKEGINSL